MSVQEWRVAVQPGDGVVASAPGVVILALPATQGQQRFTDGLLDLVGTPPPGDAAAGGRRLLRLVARAAAAAEPEDVPAFAVVAEADPGVAVLLCGAVDLSVDSPRGMELLSGRAAETWLDRILEPGFTTLSAAPSGETLRAPFPRSDLRAGVVGGRGFVLTPRGAPESLGVQAPLESTVAEPVIESLAAAEPLQREPLPVAGDPEPGHGRVETAAPPTTTPLPVAEPDVELGKGGGPPAVISGGDAALPGGAEPTGPAGFVAVSLSDPLPAAELVPLPVVGAAEAGPGVDASGVQVAGIYCSRRHFNDPDAVYCSSCGISMVHQTHNRVVGPRPPLGVLVADDGATYSLDEEYVLGREPHGDPAVQAGAARPLMIEDPERSVSRVHARVTLREWEVRVSDAHSANGTAIARPGDSTWTRLAPDEPLTIPPGTRIRLGTNRVITFDSHHRR